VALQRESEIYARLQYMDCEHLLQIRALERTEQYVGLVTAFAEGGDLRRQVESKPQKRLPPSDAAPIALQIAKGLAALHEAEIVHRDLKPENVLLSGSSWKLADFGIAKNRANAAPGYTFQQAGTYGYAAPEQFEGTAADPSADVYSFGKVLVFMLTGKTDLDGVPVQYSDLRKLAFKCASPIPTSRPAMTEVVELLEALVGS
jgi:serine/threonine protein kinase